MLVDEMLMTPQFVASFAPTWGPVSWGNSSSTLIINNQLIEFASLPSRIVPIENQRQGSVTRDFCQLGFQLCLGIFRSVSARLTALKA